MKSLITILEEHKAQFATVVDFSAAQQRLVAMNFTAENSELSEHYIADINCFILYVEQKIKNAAAAFGIGGYAENRILYKRFSQFTGEESRSIHLGLDIWGPAGTKVYAPLGGMVHSFAYNEAEGDYGATIILQHQIEMVSFYTLYGHLSKSDIAFLRKGMVITRGQCFGHFGQPNENGNWPPHLHFQIIEDIGMKEGDYPGVCMPSEKAKYFANSPNPDLILQLNKYL